MIHQSYELNKDIPNIELLLYKMFCSPISTKEERKGEKDLLAGNIFAQKGLQLPIDVYLSLLHTVTVIPKKKHFKKIVDYLVKYEDVNRIPQNLINQIINVGIANQYPETIGQYMRDFIIRSDLNIDRNSFIKFIVFLEQCKGFEEDAKKFLTLT